MTFFIASRTPLDRWRAIKDELNSCHISTSDLSCVDANLRGRTNPGPYGHVNLSDLDGNSRTVAHLESVFSGHGMTIVDVTVPSDELRWPSRIWFHPRKRLRFLRYADRESIDQRAYRVGDLLEVNGLKVVDSHVREAPCGPHRRLTLNDLRDVEGGLELDLGLWAWTYIRHDKMFFCGYSCYSTEADDIAMVNLVAKESAKYTGHPLTAPSWMMIAEAAAVTSVLVPFVQAFVTAAGQDCYEALYKLIRRHASPTERTRLIDEKSGTELVFDPPLPDEVISQLANFKPRDLKGNVVEWDQHAARWRVTAK